MKLLCGVLLFIGVFALNNAASQMTLKRISTDQLLMQQLMDARANNPAYVGPCFGIYIPILNEILDEFQTSYQLCITNADDQNSILNAEAANNRTLIDSAAQGVCQSMTECSALDDSLSFFDCYSQVGDGNVRSVYILTNNASEVAANLREEYRIVENNLEKCQNASERAYVENTGNTSDALNYCLANGPPETVTTTTEDPSTAEIDTTTPEEVETAAPEEAFEEEDLSRSAPLLTMNKYKRSISGRGN